MMITVTSLVTRPKDIKPKGIRHQQSPSVRMKREGKHWIVWRELRVSHAVNHLCTHKPKSSANEPMKRNSERWKRRNSI